MMSPLQLRIAAALVLVFLAGIAVGVLGGAWHARHAYVPVAHGVGMAPLLRDHLQHELNLSAEQYAKIAPIVDRSTGELEQIRQSTNQRVGEVFMRANAEMAPLLNADQQARLNKLQERHQRAMQTMQAPPSPP